MLPDCVGNNGRLAFPIAEVNNTFRSKLFCKLNVNLQNLLSAVVG